MNANETWNEVRSWCAAHSKLTAVIIAAVVGLVAGAVLF